MFTNRPLVIATKHRKETVIAPLVEAALGVRCFVAPDFDTDLLGTFSGEIERTQDPVATARQKCLLAMEATQCDLGIANEGSFGPHPAMFFVPADEEIMILIDKKNDLEIIVREISTNTNFAHATLTTEQELLQFAAKAQFPAHRLILRSPDSYEHIIKDIYSIENLKLSFYNLINIYKKVHIETDMRAMHNPSRMAVIQATTHKLLAKIQSQCPQCDTPGFGIVSAKKGLPCSLCGFPTQSVLAHIYECKKCNFQNEILYPYHKQEEDPTYCDFCNP